ncbi:MAG: ATP-binding protein [Bryobacteraceae bacterium]|jgi:PAS domain S-box-containing protein
MRKRLLYGFAGVLLILSVLLVVWQGSFKVRFGEADPERTLIFWAISTLTFVLMVILGWILVRTGIKLYIERQSNREGSRIKTKLLLGALALSFMPVFFLVLWGYEVLNFNLKAWFNAPAQNQLQLFVDAASLLDREVRNELTVYAALLAAQPETRRLLTEGVRAPGFLERFCKEQGVLSAAILPAKEGPPLDAWKARAPPPGSGRTIETRFEVKDGARTLGTVVLEDTVPVDVAQSKAAIAKLQDQWARTNQDSKELRRHYTMLMALIALFVLFVATWIALFLARQISVPIAALLEAAGEVRKGNLAHRVQVRAADELGSLVRSFNQMTRELEASGRELDRRRRFTEAILESIPTGVISVRADGSVLSVNRALAKIFPAEHAAHAERLEDLFSRDDAAVIRRLMKRARRTGAASTQIDLRTANRKSQLEVTVAALEETLTSGFVVVLEDVTELLRAQKTEAWHEVARRVAHEIKNPLTPIALSAERIHRQLGKLDLPPVTARIVSECAATISQSVESVKTLVDEFSQFARFPSAQLAPSDLNEVVREALAVFEGRLEGIEIRTGLAPGLPPVNLDREQFRRVVVNLVDNAAEAMQDSLVKELRVFTRLGAAETVELVVADSGRGIGAEDKEKLFLPYFSTKNRGTGLGLAIVSHIIAEHNGQIRVEDNQPVGARFTVEIPAIVEADAAENAPPAEGTVAPRPAAV